MRPICGCDTPWPRLIASPDKIIHFPIRKPFDRYAVPSYDAVFTRTELRFRRSEWIDLCRQLDKAHRIRNFCLLYDEKRLCSFSDDLLKSDRFYRAEKRLKSEVNTLLGDTVFFAMIKENCYLTHADICRAIAADDKEEFGFPVEGYPNHVIGYFLPKAAVQLMVEEQELFLDKKNGM